MLIKKPADIRSSEITDKRLCMDRRKFIIAGAAALGSLALEASPVFQWTGEARADVRLAGITKSPYSTSETRNSLKDITTYNNYYEFGTDKYSPAENAKRLAARPWTIAVEGEIKKPRRYDVDEIAKLAPLEERIYRLRC